MSIWTTSSILWKIIRAPIKKLVLTLNTVKHQMKGMAITSPLVPLSYLWEVIGYYSLSKSSIFFSKRCDQLCSSGETQLFRHFFSNGYAPFLDKLRYWHETKAKWSSKHQIFMGRSLMICQTTVTCTYARNPRISMSVQVSMERCICNSTKVELLSLFFK